MSVQMSAGVGRDGSVSLLKIFSNFSVFSSKWEIRLSAEHKACEEVVEAEGERRGNMGKLENQGNLV